MRYRELLEAKVDFAKKLQEDCRPFLAAIGGKINEYKMYRGTRYDPKSFKVVTTRLDDRKPRDSKQIKHDQVNDYFTRTFGEPFRNSVFVSGSAKQAKEFGESSVMIPIGDFTFLWAPDVRDISLTLAGRWPSAGGWEIDPEQEQTDSLLSRYEYTTSDLIGAIKSNQEIMIRCKEYYLVNEDYLDKTTQVTK